MGEKIFTSTQCSTREDKMRFFHQYIRWVRSNFDRKLFTKKFYQQLSMMFGHIAHYNLEGFYDTWCLDWTQQLDLLKRHQMAETVCGGDPMFTWVDVEHAIAV